MRGLRDNMVKGTRGSIVIYMKRVSELGVGLNIWKGLTGTRSGLEIIPFWMEGKIDRDLCNIYIYHTTITKDDYKRRDNGKRIST